MWLSSRLAVAEVFLCFDRYRDYSIKSSTRFARAAATRVHQLNLNTSLPARDAVLKNSTNKTQLNKLICEQILHDEKYLKNVTQNHKLVVTGDDAVPIQIFKGRKMPRLDLASTHEEADMIITQQAISVAKEDPGSRVSVVCDDTDVFALLLHFYSLEKLESSLTMQSPVHGRSCIDMKETADTNSDIIPQILALHALTGCDSVAARWNWKNTAIAVAKKATIWISSINQRQTSQTS